MAPVDLDIPLHATTSASTSSKPGLVEAVLDLPAVTSACFSIGRVAAPVSLYLSLPAASLASSCTSARATVEQAVLPHLPATITSCASKVAESVASSLRSLDTMACEHLEDLVAKNPCMKKEVGELFKEGVEATTDKLFRLATFLASFTLCQVALKVADSSMATTEALLRVARVDGESKVVMGLRGARNTATVVRKEGARRNGSPRMARMEAASLAGALAEVTGLLGVLGLRLQGEVQEEQEVQ